MYTTYVKQIPWDTSIPQKFLRERSNIQRSLNVLEISATGAVNPAIQLCKKTLGSFLEKEELRWWSLESLQNILSGDQCDQYFNITFARFLTILLREFKFQFPNKTCNSRTK